MVQAASAKQWLSISDSTDETEQAGGALASLPRTRISSQGTCPDEPALRVWDLNTGNLLRVETMPSSR